MRLLLVPLIFATILVVAPTAVHANKNQAAAEKIAASLGDRFPGYDIAVSYQSGKVRLVGEVASVEMIYQASELVKKVPGVQVAEVDNGLRVAGRTPAPAQGPVRPVEYKKEAPKQSILQPRPTAANIPVPVPGQNPIKPAPEKVLVTQMAAKDVQVQPSVPKPTRPQPQQGPQMVPTPQDFANQQAQMAQQNAQRAYPRPDQMYPQQQGQGYPQQGYPQQGHPQQGPMVYQGQMPPQGMPMQGIPMQGMPQGDPQGMPMPGMPMPGMPMAYQSEAYGPQGPMPGQYNQPNLPEYAWPSYAAYPNYAEVCYPKQYSPKAWPYIGPFYPYPQAPLGWRKVTLEHHDGWWWLDFDDGAPSGPFSPLFRQPIRYTY